MAERRGEKLGALVERAKDLSNKAKWSLNVGLALLAAGIALSKLLRPPASILVIAEGLVAAGLMALVSINILVEAEGQWREVLRDPMPRRTLILFAAAILSALAMGATVLAAALLGKW